MEDSSITSTLLTNDDEQVNMEISVKKESTRGGWSSSGYLIGVEVAERFAMYGVYGNLITFLTTVLNESTATAAMNVNIWYGAVALLPLLGAFIADTYWGRFNMILVASSIYVMGLVMLTLSVSVIPARFRHITFFLSLYLVAIGEGGHKPCVQTFAADQFDEDSPEEKKAKSSFFNWWYLAISGGAAAALLIMTYIQDNVGWLAGFGLPAIAMAISLVIFLFGKRSYRIYTPQGSPLVRVVQVFVAAFLKRDVSVSRDNGFVEFYEEGVVGAVKDNRPNATTLSRTNQFKCLDKATVVDEIDTSNMTIDNWRLCTVKQVEEAKILLRLLPIWLNCLIYAIIFGQGSTFFTKQGSTMDTSVGDLFNVPPASLQVSIGVVVLVFVPIYDRILIPFTRKFTKIPSGITMLQRIGIGMFLAPIEMVIAALVETRRLEIASEYGLIDDPNAIVPMSIWWLLPQYMISGVSDVFTIIGLQELFYSQMPPEMKSIGSAMYLSVMGIGSLLSSVVITVVQYFSTKIGEEWLVNNLNLAHLNDFYWLLAFFGLLGFGAYIGVARNFLYKSTRILS